MTWCIIVDELRNFDMETQIRSVVAIVLDPIADRTQGHHNEIKDLKRAVETMQRSLEEMDRFIKVDLNLKSFLADIKKR